MKYLLLMYNAEEAFTDEELPGEQARAVGICDRLHASGSYVDASPLQPVATATSVRVINGRRLVTDGPFAETKEQLGGYVLVDVATLDEALEIAAQFPSAFRGTVEVRPLEAIPSEPTVPGE